ncbi:MAG TPA: FecR domain-containing protein [Planctomycetota bacterium]|nr:FecR domain-containing protein [Planctomycetota bacterium]
MSSSDRCPDNRTLRAVACGVEPAGAHIASCSRCQELIEAFRAEEKALRDAVRTPLSETRARALAALRKETRGGSRRVPRPSGPRVGAPFVLSILAVFVTVLVLVKALGTPPPVETKEPAPEGPRIFVPKGDELPPPRTPAPESPPAEVVSEDATTTIPEVAPTPSSEAPEAPPAPLTEAPSPSPVLPEASREEGALAVLRSGPVKAGSKSLSPGARMRDDSTLVVGTSVAVVESEGAASFVLAPGSQFKVSKGARGELVLSVAKGRVFARSLGKSSYAVSTRDGRAQPHGTEFVVALESGSTRVTTIEGTVRVSVDGAGSADVRPGFELGFARGKAPSDPRPATAIAKAVEWLPASTRPKELPTPGLLLSYSFATGLPPLGQGAEWQGMRVVNGAVSAEKSTQDTSVSVMAGLEDPSFPKLDPDITVEAKVKVDRATRVVILIWDDRIKDNLGLETTVEPGAWTTIGAPLRDFKPRTPGSKETVQAGDGAHGFTIYAGDGKTLELSIASVVFSKGR